MDTKARTNLGNRVMRVYAWMVYKVYRWNPRFVQETDEDVVAMWWIVPKAPRSRHILIISCQYTGRDTRCWKCTPSQPSRNRNQRRETGTPHKTRRKMTGVGNVVRRQDLAHDSLVR